MLESQAACGVNVARVIAQRIAAGAGHKGFGNARAVRNTLDEMIANQTQRLGTKKLHKKTVTAMDYRILTREDTIGVRPDYSKSPLIKELTSMVGLQAVKHSFQQLLDLATRNFDREMGGGRPETISLVPISCALSGTVRMLLFSRRACFAAALSGADRAYAASIVSSTAIRGLARRRWRSCTGVS